jgi:hypothetical protein
LRCVISSIWLSAFVDLLDAAGLFAAGRGDFGDHTDWKDWLGFERANASLPLPGTAEWQAWRAAHN